MPDPLAWVNDLYASCIAGGVALGACVSIFNSWRV